MWEQLSHYLFSSKAYIKIEIFLLKDWSDAVFAIGKPNVPGDGSINIFVIERGQIEPEGTPAAPRPGGGPIPMQVRQLAGTPASSDPSRAGAPANPVGTPADRYAR